MAGKRNTKEKREEIMATEEEVVTSPAPVEEEADTVEPIEDTAEVIEDQPAVETEVVDMDKKLEETPVTTGLTPFQQYMREKILNATKD